MRNKLAVILILIIAFSVFAAGCSDSGQADALASVKEDAITAIEGTSLDELSDSTEAESLKTEYLEKVNAAESEKDVEAILSEFKDKISALLELPAVTEETKGDGSNKEAADTATSSASGSTAAASNTSSGKGSSASSSSSKPATSSGSATTSKPAGNGTSGSTSSSAGSSITSSSGNAPAHQHNWQPVYETVTKYRTEYVDKYYCGGKYFDDYDEGYEYYLNAPAGVGSLSPVTVEQQVPYQEQVLTGYKCSCGATK